MNNILYHKLMYTSRLVAHNTHDSLEKIGLYRGQPPILFELWKKDGLSRRELVDKRDLKPATITKMIRRLEKNGFVESKPDITDGRLSRVYLTKKGKEIKGQVEEIYTNLEKETFNNFSNEELKQLENLLNKIIENIKRSNK